MEGIDKKKLGELKQIHDGNCPPPFFATQDMLCGRELIFGDINDKNNQFQSQDVSLNLLPYIDYNLALPWFIKVRTDGNITNYIFFYIENVKALGCCERKCWKST